MAERVTGFTPKKKVTRVEGFTPTKKVEKEPTFWEDVKEGFKENWPQYAGATTGAILGTPGGLPGMAAGAALGGAAGESYKQIGQHIVGSEKAPTTSAEAAKRIGRAGIVEGATEVVGGQVARVGGKALRPFAKYVTEEAKIAAKVMSKYMPKKTVPLLPAEMTEHRGMDFLHNIAEASILGGHRLAQYKNIIRKDAIIDLIDDLATKYGEKVDPDILGETITNVAAGKWKKFKDVYTAPIYNKVERMAAGVEISLDALKKSVADHQTMTLGGAASGDNIVKAIRELDDVVDYQTAKDLRSRILDEISEFEVSNPKARAIGVGKQLMKKLNDIMDKELQRQAPEAGRLWRAANAIYKSGSKKYNNVFVRKLIKQAENEPERVMRSIFKNGGITGINRIKGVVGPQEWSKMKSWYVRDVISKSTDINGKVSGNGVLSLLYNQSKGMGKKALNAIFKPHELTSLRNAATALKVANERQAEGQGRMLIQLVQAGAIAGAAYGGVGLLTGGDTSAFTTGSATLLVGPYALSRIMLNPVSASWLVKGLKLPPTSKAIPGIIGRLSTFASRAEQFVLNELQANNQQE